MRRLYGQDNVSTSRLRLAARERAIVGVLKTHVWITQTECALNLARPDSDCLELHASVGG